MSTYSIMLKTLFMCIENVVHDINQVINSSPKLASGSLGSMDGSTCPHNLHSFDKCMSIFIDLHHNVFNVQ